MVLKSMVIIFSLVTLIVAGCATTTPSKSPRKSLMER